MEMLTETGRDSSDETKDFAVFSLTFYKVILYGSRAKGNYKNGSDIDLCFFGKDLTKDIIYKIDLVLDDLLLPYSFDLSIYKDLENQELKDHIDRIGTVFYSP